MRRSLLLIVGLTLAAGCQYEPLDNEANKPQLGNAVLERDIIVTGTSWVLYLETDNGQLGDFLCTTEQHVEGWASDELNDETCVGCGATYTLGFTTVDSTCDFGAGATADIAFTPLSFFDQANETSFWNWLSDNEAIEFVNATWSPRGPSGWEARLGVFEDDWASPPDQDNVDRSCEGDICAESRWWYPTADWYGKWWLDLDIDLDGS